MIIRVERDSCLRHHWSDGTLMEERHRLSCALILAFSASIRFFVGLISGTRSSTTSSLPFIFASTSFIKASWYLSRYSLKLKGFFIILISCPASSSSSFSTSGGFLSSGKSRGVRTSSADRKSTRLNSSHQIISYAVFCLKKKKQPTNHISTYT